ncbi:MAG: hypothetical protein QXG97_07405 [Nitrososphaerota archaeon]
MLSLRRREICILLYIIPAAIILINHFTGELSAATSEVLLWASTLATFAILLGVINLFQHHITILARRRREWPYSTILLASFIVTFAFNYIYPTGYDFVINRLLASLQMALLAYVGFYSYTLFFRASGTKNPYVLILLISILLGLFYNLPMRDVIWTGWGPLGKWVNDVPNTGGMNALVIGVGIGTIALFIRTILGYEESYLGG